MNPIKNKKPVRSFTGEKWRTNGTNKKYLAADFDNKCAYCDDWDKFSGGYNSYHVEHFAPKEKFKHLEFVYDNLLYSCPYCNISKSNKWIGSSADECVVGNQGFVDPCTDEYYKHLERDNDGNIIYLSPIGEYMYYELKLYLRRHFILYNLERIRLRRIALKEKIEEKTIKGEDVSTLNEVYNVICKVFCEYYELLLQDEPVTLLAK
ncbi:HNH endonuclease [Brevibacillus parabrevis]|uniref:HNH endonuclease n=1 Tax=Brevibacillus parabrevis TaxID=54914 RepID=UPI0026860D3F|nr:HNH endonuclease [Brevibacillus parabrevis]MED1722055.1 HNH endonuclease [Brevibacillus parabrevis]